MTHEELIENAKAAIKRFPRFPVEKITDASAELFTAGRVLEAAVVYLRCRERDNYFTIHLNLETGDFMGMEYSRGKGKAESK